MDSRKTMEKEKGLAARFYRSIRKDGPSEEAIRVFREIIQEYYRRNRRNFPWRRTRDPYKVLISEVMLQQTGTERVRGKYGPFLRRFPDFTSLAQTPLREVLKMWHGLGYNRRALALKKLADTVVKQYRGRLPSREDELRKLPGIGGYSAAAILAFAHNRPTLFIETNIRRVFIHFFFHDRENIVDSLLLPLIEKTLDTTNPREWYYALMDYGAMLKDIAPNPNRRSAHYRRQTPFHGSDRQLRGKILRALTEKGLSEETLTAQLQIEPSRVGRCLAQLMSEGFLKKKGKTYRIA